MIKTLSPILLLLIFGLFSCNTSPKPISPGVDACSFCKMAFANNRFGAEIITKKGDVYKFDDMFCLISFKKRNNDVDKDIKETWLINYYEPHNFIKASKAFLLKSKDLHSPMGGNIACFANEAELKEANKNIRGEEVSVSKVFK